jgi:hypothetical protein
MSLGLCLCSGDKGQGARRTGRDVYEGESTLTVLGSLDGMLICNHLGYSGEEV